MGAKVSIGGQDLLAQIEQESPKLGIFLRRYVIPAIETTAFHAGVSPTGNTAPVAPPESISVNVSGEHAQVVVNHSAPVGKNVRYITHFSTNPQFSNCIIKDHGCSRAPEHVFLPTKDGSGATHQWYAATVAQEPGALPSVTYYGGVTPQPFTMSGTSQVGITPGTGSGTAQNGGQALVGLGVSQIRPAPSPKRSVGR
jgi:hypothetical protein